MRSKKEKLTEQEIDDYFKRNEGKIHIAISRRILNELEKFMIEDEAEFRDPCLHDEVVTRLLEIARERKR